MSEGGANAKMKSRNGARIFKNPPQPHMCIKDFLQGSTSTCYVNVLSWDKVAMPDNPSQPVPLFGGMKVSPPRGEKEDVSVYAVIVNPEVLRINGKNAEDPEKRSTLIEVLLDFVETINKGVVFARIYTIMKDRDITGELKEVWTAVQAKKDKAPQEETWVDLPPSVPQYSQYAQQQEQEQQDNQSQPPCYPTQVTYGPERLFKREFSRKQQQRAVNYQLPGVAVRSSIDPCYNQFIAQDNPSSGSKQFRGTSSQEGCPAYMAPQNQLHQLLHQMMPQCINANVPASNLNLETEPNMVGLNLANPFPDYMNAMRYMMNQQQRQNMLHNDMRTLSTRQQQQQQQQPVPQYDLSSRFDVLQHPRSDVRQHVEVAPLRPGKPYMGVAQKNNVTKRQTNSPKMSKDTVSSGTTKNPVKLLQRERPSSAQDTKEGKVQVTDLDEEETTIPNELFRETSKSCAWKVAQNMTLRKKNWDEHKKHLESKNGAKEQDEVLENGAIPDIQGLRISEKEVVEERVVVGEGEGEEEEEEEEEEKREGKDEEKKLKNGFAHKSANKRAQTTVNNILKNVFKLPSTSKDDGTSLFVRSISKKPNGEIKAQTAEQEDVVSQGYTILRKQPEAMTTNQEDELSQVPSIQDCKDASEFSAVVS